MNPQPSPAFGNFLALIFVLFVAYHAVVSFKDATKHIDIKNADLITLGYVENSPVYIIDKNAKDFTSLQLFKDCVSALNALGMKKSEAKSLATKVFSSSDPQPQSVQEFLMIALRK